MFRSATFYIILALAISLAGVGYLYKTSLEEKAALELTNATLKDAIVAYSKKIEEEQIKQQELRTANDKSSANFREAKRQLDQLKGRQSTVKAKPGLVENKIQTSFDEYMKDLQCATGANEQCVKY